MQRRTRMCVLRNDRATVSPDEFRVKGHQFHISPISLFPRHSTWDCSVLYRRKASSLKHAFVLNGLTRCPETCACDLHPAVPRAVHTGLVGRWFIVSLTKCVCVCVCVLQKGLGRGNSKIAGKCGANVG